MIEPFWKGMSVVLTRRMLIALLAGTLLSLEAAPSLARDGGGESDGGHDDGGHDDGGHDDGGHDDGGHDDGGSDNSGHDDGGGDGKGGDDGGGDKGGDDKGGDDGGKRSGALSQDDALDEREKGKVIPLETALRIANGKVRGRVIDVDLSVRSGSTQYRVKIRRDDGVIKTVRLNARTGKVIGFFGF